MNEAIDEDRPVTIEGLQAAVRVLKLSLQQEREWRAQFDCCMCGNRMDDHDIGSGHSPVSIYDYEMDRLQKQAAAAPDMLDALKAAYGFANHIKKYTTDDVVAKAATGVLARVEAAISKATAS